MASAAQVIGTALKLILVEGADVDLDASEYSDAIFTMNNYMLALDAQGVRLGYTVVSSLSDTVTIPDGALRGLVYNLALELAPEYNGTINPATTRGAQQGLEAMEILGINIVASAFPGNLPRGTGADYGYDNSISRYYPDLEAEILAESTGAIGLETGTAEAINGN